MACLILHIGYPKTGTSSLQRYCYTNRAYLAEKHGVTYYDFIENHGILSALFNEDPSTFQPIRMLGYRNKADSRAFIERAKVHLENQVANLKTPFFLISGEGFSNVQRQLLEPIRGYFDSLFDEVRVVCYVRAPLPFLDSALQQAIKGGSKFSNIDTNSFVQKPEGSVDDRQKTIATKFEKRLGKYIELFGKERVHLLKFDPKTLKHQNIVYDFFQRVLDIRKDDLEISPTRINERLSAEAVRFLEAYNASVPFYLEGVMNPDRAGNLNYLFQVLSSTEGSRFNAADTPINFDNFLNVTRSDVKWLSDVTDGRIDFSDEVSAPVPSAKVPSERDALQFLARVFNKVLIEKEATEVKSRVLQALFQLKSEMPGATERLHNALLVVEDISLLKHVSHTLRVDGHYDLSVVAIERWIANAKDDDTIKSAEQAMAITQHLIRRSRSVGT